MGVRGYMGFASRAIRAYGKRVADGDPVDLADMLKVREEFDKAIEAAIVGQRATFSWQQIADATGIPRQNLWRKYGHLKGEIEGATGPVSVTSSVA